MFIELTERGSDKKSLFNINKIDCIIADHYQGEPVSFLFYTGISKPTYIVESVEEIKQAMGMVV